MRLLRRFDGRRAVVFGLGASGQAAAVVLSRLNAEVVVVDHSRSESVMRRAESLEAQGIRCQLGRIEPETMRRAEVVVLSPGVAPSVPELAIARSSGALVISELELAYQVCDSEFLAITGTKGKSTTARLLGRILGVAGFETVVGGNLPGEPLCKKAFGLGARTKVVAEVSSFQLEAIESFCPHIACITNLATDHLDRYPTLQDYHRAKLRIFENQSENDFLVVNCADEHLERLTAGARPARWFFGPITCRQRPGVFCRSKSVVVVDGPKHQQVFETDAVGLPGRHNLENVMAATAMAWLSGVGGSQVKEALEGFELSPHTLEVFAECGGIRFVDDSHSTNTLSVLRALETFEGPIILIAGGKEKGCDFKELLPQARGKVKAIIAIGQAAPAIKAALGEAVPVFITSKGMDRAVQMAAKLATSGDTVLLSPGCSSFDMFKDFKDRGDSFKRAVFQYLEVGGFGHKQAS